jgi:hypothetical protein
MKALLLLVLLAVIPGIVNAASLYKCSRNGQSSYQDSPCDHTSSQTKLQPGGVNPMLGCYVARFPAWESAGTGHSETFEILAITGSEYRLQFREEKNKQSIPMKRATPEELRAVSEGFNAHFSDGISMKWPQGTPNQKPVGVYKGKADGKSVIFAFFFMSNGLAERTECR